MNILDVMKEITELSEKLAVSVDSDSLDLLIFMVKRSKASSYFLDSRDDYLVAHMVKPVVGLMASVENIPSNLLPKLVGLADDVGADFGGFVASVAKNGTRKEILEVVNKGGEKAARIVVTAYLQAPRESAASALIDAGCIKAYVSLPGPCYAGCSLNMVVNALVKDLGEDICAQAFTAMFEDRNDFDDVISNINEYVKIFQRHQTRKIVGTLSRAMSLMWSSSGHRHAGGYETLFRKPSAKDCCSAAAEILRTCLPEKEVKLFDALYHMAGIPFYEYRSLVKHAKDLADAFACFEEGQVLLFKDFSNIVNLKRVCVSALRYARQELKEDSRSFFDSALCVADSGLAQKIIGIDDGGEGANSGPIFDPAREYAAAYDEGARIWPKNYAVVAKFYEPVIKAVNEFKGICSKEWGRDENGLSERLMHSLLNGIKGLAEDADVKTWIAEKYGHGSIDVSEPPVREYEKVWGADIGIVVDLKVAGTVSHRWGYLLQAKKAQGSPKPTRWDIDRQQAQDIILRSNASYYLLYSPETEAGLPWVIPAKTVLSALDAQEKWNGNDRRSIPYRVGQALGKPFADFFVEDVIGAWSGEPDSKLVELINDGLVARAVIKVSVRLGLDR